MNPVYPEFSFSSLDNSLYSRFSRDGSRRVNNVQLGVQGILLWDGGYSATINKDQRPARPSQCSNYAKDKIQSRSFGDSGKGAISIKIETANGGTIGCESYVIIGFDAKVSKIGNAFWPIKTVKKLNKQLDVCTGNNNGCDGFFWWFETRFQVSSPREIHNLRQSSTATFDKSHFWYRLILKSATFDLSSVNFTD